MKNTALLRILLIYFYKTKFMWKPGSNYFLEFNNFSSYFTVYLLYEAKMS